MTIAWSYHFPGTIKGLQYTHGFTEYMELKCENLFNLNKTDRLVASPHLFSCLNIKWILMIELKTTKFIDAKPLKGPERMCKKILLLE